jgi:hypothetical protein
MREQHELPLGQFDVTTVHEQLTPAQVQLNAGALVRDCVRDVRASSSRTNVEPTNRFSSEYTTVPAGVHTFTRASDSLSTPRRTSGSRMLSASAVFVSMASVMTGWNTLSANISVIRAQLQDDAPQRELRPLRHRYPGQRSSTEPSDDSAPSSRPPPLLPLPLLPPLSSPAPGSTCLDLPG